jgi:CRISPR-associated protein Cas5t
MMLALRIQVDGTVTSFRHPHFMHGVQPTYEMPPPATIYGHVCSALGEWVDPASFRFALRFSAETRFTDYEHVHLVGREGVKLSPFKRELLFQPRLTLYLDRPDWYDAFRSPAFVVTLGRSQDLMRYRAVERVELEQVETGYIADTYLPLSAAADVRHRTIVTMPRFIDPERTPFWGQYALVRQAQPWPQLSWCDPDAPRWRGLMQTVLWNRCTADGDIST